MDGDSDNSGWVDRRSWLESAAVPGTIPLPPSRTSVRKAAGSPRLEALLDLVLRRKKPTTEQSPTGLGRDLEDRGGS